MKVRELSPELAKKAKDELFEVTERIPQDIQTLKDWISKQPHLHIRTDDQWLLAFLRGCKFSLERTKEKLDLYYTMRTIAPEVCMPFDPMEPSVQEILKSGNFAVPLPKTGKPDEPRIVLMRMANLDPDKMNFIHMMRMNHMIINILLMEDDQTVVAGALFVMDLKGATIRHFMQMTPSLMKKMTVSGQDSVPLRQKGGHYVNNSPALQTIFDLAMNFYNEKMKSRIHLHSDDFESLYKFIPKASLPAEYGGDAGPIQGIIDDWKLKVESYRDWFLEEMQYKTNEKKRIGTPKNSETLFGIEGSFRKLNVD